MPKNLKPPDKLLAEYLTRFNIKADPKTCDLFAQSVMESWKNWIEQRDGVWYHDFVDDNFPPLYYFDVPPIMAVSLDLSAITRLNNI